MADQRERAVDVLTSPDLAHIVDFVAYADRAGVVVRRTAGKGPLTDADYPSAQQRLAELFADPRAPDLVVVHTGAHFWPERGGHPGEHGSLNAEQSRAPLLVSGPGVRARGLVDATARVVDIGPTLAYLFGAGMPGATGRPLDELVAPGARHVVGLLWDGVNCSDFIELATTGALPHVARLLENGCMLSGGAIAEFPSVTLTNHCSALTGVGPGRHGLVNNSWYERGTGECVRANESTTWHTACEWLRPGVETVFEAVARARPGTRTACVDEPIDRGAGYSTFALVRAQHTGNGAHGMFGGLPDPQTDPHASPTFVAAEKDYAFSTAADALGLAQVLELWADDATRPDLLWWNFMLTDTGHHNGGPRSPDARAALADSDRRLGAFLAVLDGDGSFDETVFLLTSDHGSEANDPSCRGDWDESLREAGIDFLDEAYGFLYLGS